jgi:hypothetical protein
MKSFAKFISIISIVVIVLGVVEKWYSMFLLGRYWEHASFIGTAFAGFIFPLVFLYIAVIGIRYIVKS